MPNEMRGVTRLAVVFLGLVLFFTAQEFDSRLQVVAKSDPLRALSQEWRVSGFVVGGDDPFSMVRCGKTTVASPTDRTLSLSVACGDAGDYYFRLKQGPETGAYLMTVKSRIGISIDDFPVTYVDGEGWLGERDQLVDGETVSLSAMVAPIEGRNWHGWTIQVLPTEAIIVSPDELRKPYFKIDLTRRK